MDDPDDQRAQDKEPDIQPRSYNLYESDLQRFCYTPDCPRCRAKLHKRGQREHTLECRNRIRDNLLETESGRQRAELAAR